MISFASVKGPSVTVTLPPADLMRKPFELGSRPPVASTTPAFVISSIIWPILAMRPGLGGMPASEFLSALTIIMNRIVIPLLLLRQLGPELRFAFDCLAGAKVLHLKELAKLDLALRP